MHYLPHASSRLHVNTSGSKVMELSTTLQRAEAKIDVIWRFVSLLFPVLKQCPFQYTHTVGQGTSQSYNMASRLETNFNRLLHRCEAMAAERGKDSWRLEKVGIG